MWDRAGPGQPLRQFRRRVGQRDPFGQAQLAAGEDRGCVAQPAAGMLLQQLPHCPAVSVSYPDGGEQGGVPQRIPVWLARLSVDVVDRELALP